MSSCTNAIQLINEERYDQINKHGFTIKRDYELNKDGSLIDAAEMLLNIDNYMEIDQDSQIFDNCPTGWDIELFTKMCKKPYYDRLIIAASLIAAHIDMMNYHEEEYVTHHFKMEDNKLPRAVVHKSYTGKYIGYHSAEFKVRFKGTPFLKDDIIMPLCAKEYQMIAISDPTHVDRGDSLDSFVYVQTFILFGANEKNYMPEELLQEGIEWVILGRAVGEESTLYGTIKT